MIALVETTVPDVVEKCRDEVSLELIARGITAAEWTGGPMPDWREEIDRARAVVAQIRKGRL